jgi:hypothetical protein
MGTIAVVLNQFSISFGLNQTMDIVVTSIIPNFLCF